MEQSEEVRKMILAFIVGSFVGSIVTIFALAITSAGREK